MRRGQTNNDNNITTVINQTPFTITIVRGKNEQMIPIREISLVSKSDNQITIHLKPSTFFKPIIINDNIETCYKTLIYAVNQ